MPPLNNINCIFIILVLQFTSQLVIIKYKSKAKIDDYLSFFVVLFSLLGAILKYKNRIKKVTVVEIH